MNAEPTRFFSKRRVRRLLLLALGLVVTWLLCSFAVSYKLTRRPHPMFAEPAPEVAWGPLESQRLVTSDGEQIGAWFAEGKAEGPSVLILHGNKGSRRNSLRRAEILATEGGCSVLLISLRAHGDSSGDFHDIGFSARRDVVAAVDFLQERRPDQPIIILGVSLGSAAAIFAAEDLGSRVQGYVLESPYQDLKSAVWNRTQTYLPPSLDRVAYAGLRITAPVILPRFEDISPINAIGQIPANVPVLILSGGKDTLAPPDEAEALFNRLQSHGRMKIYPNAGHHDLIDSDPELYRNDLLGFCAEVARAHPE